MHAIALVESMLQWVKQALRLVQQALLPDERLPTSYVQMRLRSISRDAPSQGGLSINENTFVREDKNTGRWRRGHRETEPGWAALCQT